MTVRIASGHAIGPAVAVAAAAVASAAPAQPGPLSVTASNDRASARPVAVTLRFRSQLECGLAVGPPIVITFPKAETVPRTVSRAAVLVNGDRAGSASVSGRRITVTVSRPTVICTSIIVGPVRIAFGRALGLGNPARPGRYAFTVTRGSESYRGALRIRA
jgi:hypothetical protein